MNKSIEAAYEILRAQGYRVMHAVRDVAKATKLSVRDIMLVLGMDYEG